MDAGGAAEAHHGERDSHRRERRRFHSNSSLDSLSHPTSIPRVPSSPSHPVSSISSRPLISLTARFPAPPPCFRVLTGHPEHAASTHLGYLPIVPSRYSSLFQGVKRRDMRLLNFYRRLIQERGSTLSETVCPCFPFSWRTDLR